MFQVSERTAPWGQAFPETPGYLATGERARYPSGGREGRGHTLRGGLEERLSLAASGSGGSALPGCVHWARAVAD